MSLFQFLRAFSHFDSYLHSPTTSQAGNERITTLEASLATAVQLRGRQSENRLILDKPNNGPQNTKTGLSPVWALTPELLEIAEADTSIIPELVALFVKDSNTRLQTLTGACARQDFKIVRAQAHSLKGSALQMGAPGLASFSSVLELSDRPGPDQCGLMMRAIGDEFILVRQAMEEYLLDTKTSGLEPDLPAKVAFE